MSSPPLTLVPQLVAALEVQPDCEYDNSQKAAWADKSWVGECGAAASGSATHERTDGVLITHALVHQSAAAGAQFGVQHASLELLQGMANQVSDSRELDDMAAQQESMLAQHIDDMKASSAAMKDVAKQQEQAFALAYGTTTANMKKV